jgi:putative addiction module CopG family antidote
MKFLLKPELEKFVAQKVKAGQFADASGVVNEALEMLKEHEDFAPRHAAYLRRELKRGIRQLDRGQYSELNAEEIIAGERRRLGKKGK